MREGLALGPGATLLGIEVVLGDHHPEMGLPTTRGRIWLEGGSGLQLFYGKNGAGKSTWNLFLRAWRSGCSLRRA
jgi:hypothetical protein